MTLPDPGLFSIPAPGPLSNPVVSPASPALEPSPIELHGGPFDGYVLDHAPDRFVVFGSPRPGLAWQHVYERSGIPAWVRGDPPGQPLHYQHVGVRSTTVAPS